MPSGSQGPISLKRSFEADGDQADTSVPIWCVNSGPIIAGKWADKPNGPDPIDKLLFQCVVGFCYIEDTTDLCHDVSLKIIFCKPM